MTCCFTAEPQAYSPGYQVEVAARRPSECGGSVLDGFDFILDDEEDGGFLLDHEEGMYVVGSGSEQEETDAEMDGSDPPVREIFTTHRQQHLQPYHRATSHGDLSACSYATSSDSSVRSSASPPTQQQYQEALRNLAESMKRSSESRRAVSMMKHEILSPEQREVLERAGERLREENARVAHRQRMISWIGA